MVGARTDAPDRAAAPDAGCAWIVEDTGIGIPAERLPRVFEPFANQTPQSPGSLELAVVHGIVTQSGGRIQVESQPGRGTRFTFALPGDGGGSRRARADAAPIGRPRARAAGRRRCGGARAAGVDARAPGLSRDRDVDAAAAMAALSQPLHALIVDLGLPEGGGEELAATIAERAAGLPTVYVSGAAATAGLVSTHPRGRTLQKPFTPRDLLVALRQALDEARPATRRSASQRS